MKRYLIPTIVALVIMAVTLSLYAQPGGDMGGGERGGGMRGGGMRGGGMRGMMGRGYGFVNPETANAAIAAMEKELANYKKALEIEIPRPEGGFQDMSDEERTKMRDAMQKRGEAIQSAMEAMEQQMMILKGGYRLRQELQEQNDELQVIADSADKANDTATAKLVQDLIAKRTKALDDTMEKLGIRGGMRGGGRMGGGQRRGGGGQQ